MKRKLFLFITLILPAFAFCQSITNPMVGYSEDYSTKIIKIEVTKTNTVITFKHTSQGKGSWVQLNKSIYLQDSQGEDRYNYVKSEGIPLRPEKLVAGSDTQAVEFKVYFEKLKAGSQEINVIERARSLADQQSGATFFNYYNVSLTKSAPAGSVRTAITNVTLSPPSPGDMNMQARGDTSATANMGLFYGGLAPMMATMYSKMLDMQLQLYSKPETIEKLARINKNYYDALIKAGFSEDAALKIITTKPLFSLDNTK